MKIHSVRAAMLATVGVASVGLAGVLASHPVGAQTTNVTIQNFSFHPGTMTVQAGSTVTWSNADGVAHTSTSDDGVWNSGPIAPGASYSRTFSLVGTYSYHCNFHPSMHGTIVVTSAPIQFAPTATATVDTAAAATATVGATATATTPVAAGPTPISIPLAAHPLSIHRAHGLTHIRWTSTAHVRGFNVYSDARRLNHHLVTSRNGRYTFSTRVRVRHVWVDPVR